MSGRYVFNASQSRLCMKMATRHEVRKGHTLTGIWVYEMPGYRRLQRTCC